MGVRTEFQRVVRESWREVREEDVTFMAGSIAYHAFVSVLPLVGDDEGPDDRESRESDDLARAHERLGRAYERLDADRQRLRANVERLRRENEQLTRQLVAHRLPLWARAKRWLVGERE